MTSPYSFYFSRLKSRALNRDEGDERDTAKDFDLV
jgi:hypothetical protein